jgi:hypothetical protein
VVKHLHTPLPCLVSSLHLFCLCLIGPRSTLDQHRRLISPPGNTSTLTISLRDLSTLECLHYLSFHLVPPSDRVRCMSVLYVCSSGSREIRLITAIPFPTRITHNSHLTSTQTLTARINAHPSPVQHLPPPPYHICNVTLLSRDNGFLRASASVVDSIHAGLRVYWGHILLTCTPPLLSKPASSFYQTAGYDQAS